MNIGLRHTHCGLLEICCFQTKVLTVIVVKSGDDIRSCKPCLKLDDRLWFHLSELSCNEEYQQLSVCLSEEWGYERWVDPLHESVWHCRCGTYQVSHHWHHSHSDLGRKDSRKQTILLWRKEHGTRRSWGYGMTFCLQWKSKINWF